MKIFISGCPNQRINKGDGYFWYSISLSTVNMQNVFRDVGWSTAWLH